MIHIRHNTSLKLLQEGKQRLGKERRVGGLCAGVPGGALCSTSQMIDKLLEGQAVVMGRLRELTESYLSRCE